MNTTAISIGGSDAAAAIGLDPYRSRVQLWLEKTGKVPRAEAGEWAEWGNLLQPVIVARVETLGHPVALADHPSYEFRDPQRPWFVAHPDAFTCDPGTPDDWRAWIPNVVGTGILEIKTTGAWHRKDWDDDAVPPAYVIQCHHYMHATTCQWALVACLIGGQRLELRRVERDEKLIGLMLQLEEEFVGLVERDEPPAPDGSDSAGEMLRLLYPSAEPGKIIQATAADAGLCAEIVKLKRAAKATEQQLAEREQTLKARLGEAETLWYEGRKLASWPTINGERKPTEGGPYSYRRLTVSDGAPR